MAAERVAEGMGVRSTAQTGVTGYQVRRSPLSAVGGLRQLNVSITDGHDSPLNLNVSADSRDVDRMAMEGERVDTCTWQPARRFIRSHPLMRWSLRQSRGGSHRGMGPTRSCSSSRNKVRAAQASGTEAGGCRGLARRTDAGLIQRADPLGAEDVTGVAVYPPHDIALGVVLFHATAIAE
jgi:hypothetical protein